MQYRRLSMETNIQDWQVSPNIYNHLLNRFSFSKFPGTKGLACLLKYHPGVSDGESDF